MRKEVIFRRVKGRNVPCKPWPQRFYVSRFLAVSDVYEIRPLTFTGLMKGVMTNFITMSYWRFMYILYRGGFLNTPEAKILSWKDWRWDFWNVKRKRKDRIK